MIIANELSRGDKVKVKGEEGVVDFLGWSTAHVLLDNGELVKVKLTEWVERITAKKDEGDDINEKAQRESFLFTLEQRARTKKEYRLDQWERWSSRDDVSEEEGQARWVRICRDYHQVVELLTETPYEQLRLIHDALPH